MHPSWWHRQWPSHHKMVNGQCFRPRNEDKPGWPKGGSLNLSLHAWRHGSAQDWHQRSIRAHYIAKSSLPWPLHAWFTTQCFNTGWEPSLALTHHHKVPTIQHHNKAAGVCKCPCTTASGHAHHLPPGKRSDIEGSHSCSSSDPLQSRHHGPATRHKNSPPGALPPWAQYGITCISWLTVKGSPATIAQAHAMRSKSGHQAEKTRPEGNGHTRQPRHNPPGQHRHPMPWETMYPASPM